MTALADKLQLKPGQGVALVDLPDGLELDLPADNPQVEGAEAADAVVIFVGDRAELDRRAALAATAACREALTWVAYPKGGRLDTDLNRDSLNSILQQHRIRGVRQISIDETWSALRFRPQ